MQMKQSTPAPLFIIFGSLAPSHKQKHLQEMFRQWWYWVSVHRIVPRMLKVHAPELYDAMPATVAKSRQPVESGRRRHQWWTRPPPSHVPPNNLFRARANSCKFEQICACQSRRFVHLLCQPLLLLLPPPAFSAPPKNAKLCASTTDICDILHWVSDTLKLLFLKVK